MFELEVSIALILVAVAFVSGFVDAIAGGGGSLTIPALLMAGVPPHVALGTNKLAGSFGSLTACITYIRRGLFNPWEWKIHVVFTAIGAVVGTLLAHWISPEWLNRILPLLVIIVALFSLFQRYWPTHFQTHHQHKGTAAVQGLVLGGYDGVAGPGTGAFWTLTNRMFYGMDLLHAIGATKLMNFTSNVISLVTFLWLGHVHLLMGTLMGIFIMTGAYVGALVAIKAPTKWISLGFNLIVIAIAARLIYQYWL